MPDWVTLSCPTCGGQLQITADTDRFACAHCGTEHIVKRGRRIVSSSAVVEGIRRVQAGVDRTASELALRRLEREIAALRADRQVSPTSGVPRWTLVFFAIPTGLFVIGIFSMHVGWLGCSLWLLGGASTIAWLVWASWTKKKKERLAREAIDRRIEEKLAEYRRHRQIVSG